MSEFKTLANPFEFSNQEIRTAVDEQGDIWFCAKDVFEALEIAWKGASGSLKNCPENWKKVWYLQTTFGEKEMIFISEPGVYQTIFRSNKPEATKFANWVCEEVLPELRKNGFFGVVSIGEQVQISKQIDSLSEKIVSTKNAYRRKLLHDQLRRLCNMVNQPMPPVEWIAKDFDQISLFDGGEA